MFDGFGGYGDGWGYVAMMFGMLVFVAMLFGAGVALSRVERRRGVPAKTSSPEELLAAGFRARGDRRERVHRQACRAP